MNTTEPTPEGSKGLTKEEFFKLIGAHPYHGPATIIWDTLEHHGYVITKENADLRAALAEARQEIANHKAMNSLLLDSTEEADLSNKLYQFIISLKELIPIAEAGESCFYHPEIKAKNKSAIERAKKLAP